MAAWVAPVAGALTGALLNNAGGSQTSSTTTVPWSGSIGFLEQLLQDAQQAYGQMDMDGYQGDLYAQLTPEQLAVIQSGLGMSALVPGAVGGAFDLGQQMLAGDFLNPETNPYLQNYIDSATRGVTENYTRNVIPSLDMGAALAGGYGGSRQGVAQGLAAEGYTQNVGDMVSNILMQNYTQERQNQMNTPAFLSQALGMGQQGLNMGYQAGGMLQADQQAQLDEAYQQYRMRQEAPWQAMAPFWNMAVQAGGLGGQGLSTSSSQGNPYAGAIGGALTGWNVYDAWQNPNTNAGSTAGLGAGFGAGNQYLPAGSPATTPGFFSQTPWN